MILFDNTVKTARKRIGEVILTSREREVIDLAENKNLTQREIARQLGIKQPTVSRIYNNALDKLNPLVQIVKEALEEVE